MNRTTSLLLAFSTSAVSLTGIGVDNSPSTSSKNTPTDSIESIIKDTTKTSIYPLDVSRLLSENFSWMDMARDSDSTYSIIGQEVHLDTIPKVPMTALDSLDIWADIEARNYSPSVMRKMIFDAIDEMKFKSGIITKDYLKTKPHVESGYNIFIRSDAVVYDKAHKVVLYRGARGAFQLMEPTFEQFTGLPYNKYAYDVKANVKAGVSYLLWLEKYCAERVPKWDKMSIEEKRDQISAAYNLGHYASVDLYHGNIPAMPSQTRKHVLRMDTLMYGGKYVPAFMRRMETDSTRLPIAQLVSDTLKNTYQ